MAENLPLEIVRAEVEVSPSSPEGPDEIAQRLQAKANELKPTLHWIPNTPSSSVFAQRASVLREKLTPVLSRASGPSPLPTSEDYRWLSDHVRLLNAESRGLLTLKLKRLPHVRSAKGDIVPRAISVAEAYMEAVAYEFTQSSLVSFLEDIQTTAVLNLRELSAVISALQLVLMEKVVHPLRA